MADEAPTGLFKDIAAVLLGGALGGADAAGGGKGDTTQFFGALQDAKARKTKAQQHAQLQTLMQKRGLLKPGEVLPAGMEDNPYLLKMFSPTPSKYTRVGTHTWVDPQGVEHTEQSQGGKPFTPAQGARSMFVPGQGWVEIPPEARTPFKPPAPRQNDMVLPPIVPTEASRGGASGQKNEAVLQGLDSGTSQVVKALAEYRIPLPSGLALRSPYWQRLLQMASQYDPSFDATQYNVRMGVRKDFTAGTSARAVNSLNTVIGHIDTLKKRADELTPSWSPLYNRVRNIARTQGGSPVVKNFNTARDAVATELTRVFRGTGGSEKDIQAWKEQLDSAGSPEQLKGVINQSLDLVDSRIDALRSQYEKGMGRPMDFSLLTPKALATLEGLRGRAVSNAPAVGTVEDGYKFKGGDPANPASWESVQ